MIAGAALVGAAASSASADKASDAQAAGTDKAVGVTARQYDQARSDLAPYRSAGTAALSRLRSLMGLESTTGAIGGDFKGSLVDISGGVPAPIADLYASDTGYKNAWDDFAMKHQAMFQSGYTSASDPAAIDREVRSRLPATGGQASQGNSADSSLLRKFSQADIDADPVYKSGLQFGLDEGTKAIERRASAGGGYDSGSTLKGLVRFANDYGSTKAGESYGRFTNDQDREFGKLSGIAGMGSGATTVGVGAGANAGSNLANLYTSGANAQGAAAIAGGNAIAGGANSIGQYAMLRQLTGGGQRTTTPASDWGE